MIRARRRLLLACTLWVTAGCAPQGSGKQESSAASRDTIATAHPDSSTTAGRTRADACKPEPGWRRAKAITPDVVPPCFTGSVGICDSAFVYVSGTGWCKPRDEKANGRVSG